MSMLRPIDQAPRDGTPLILSGPSGYASTPRYFRSGYYDAARGGWITESQDLLAESHMPPDTFAFLDGMGINTSAHMAERVRRPYGYRR